MSWTIGNLTYALTLAVMLSGSVTAAPLQNAQRKFEGRDLFALQVPTDPQIRPDGKVIAYTRISYEIMTDQARPSIWLVDVASAAQTPLVAGPGAHSSPRWSPDGKRLAYLSTAEEGRSQLFVRWMESGQSSRLAEFVEAPGDLQWSPDGKAIAFTMFAPEAASSLGEAPPKPEGATWAPPLQLITEINYRADGAGYFTAGYTHVYLISSEGGAPRQLTFGAFDESGPLSWSPDGKFIYATGNRRENWRRESFDPEIYRVSVADATVEAVTSRVGIDASATVSPDGSKIAYVGYDDKLIGYQHMRVYIADRQGRKPRSLTDSLDTSVTQVVWAADSRSMIIKYDQRGSTKIARLGLDGRVKVLADDLAGGSLDRPYTGGDFSVATDGTIAFTSNAAQRPPDISIVGRSGVRRITHLNDAFLAGKALGELRKIEVKSSFDQRRIDTWLLLPSGFERSKKYPLILEIHGGPYSAYGPRFATDYELYASAGYAVLFANPRGSTSYGQEFADQIQYAYPGRDYDDLMSAVDAAIEQGYADPDNLFVTGGSSGGALTAWIVGKTHRFSAAAAQKPVINWTSTVLTTDVATQMPKYWFRTVPWEDPDDYWRRSPLSLVGSVKTPTLVVVGDQDFRTPVSDSEQYYQALQLRGVPTAFVKVPGASHSGLTARPSQSAARASAIIAWFDRYRR